MVCKGICYKYKAKKPLMTSRYASGQKRCSNCELFVNWDGTNCPCCGIILRTNPRGTQDRQRLLLVKQQR
ncbi:MAG: hypothetical protein HRU07_05740 [Nitrosopumilus sp.]|nr:hypothetical protein [Nitrosopumilus sp.]